MNDSKGLDLSELHKKGKEHIIFSSKEDSEEDMLINFNQLKNDFLVKNELNINKEHLTIDEIIKKEF